MFYKKVNVYYYQEKLNTLFKQLLKIYIKKKFKKKGLLKLYVNVVILDNFLI